MGQVGAHEHEVAGTKIFDGVADEPPSAPRDDRGQLEFGMEMEGRSENAGPEFTAGEGLRPPGHHFFEMHAHGFSWPQTSRARRQNVKKMEVLDSPMVTSAAA